MPELHDLRPDPGSRHNSKRKGRGPGSGKGKTAGRGHKGQKARSGGNLPAGFEGGQMPLHRRLPKRGFKNFRRVEYQAVNLRDLTRVEADEEITPELMKERGLIGTNRKPVKVLGQGDVEEAYHVSAHAFSASAREKIEAAGGTVTVMIPEATRLMEGKPEFDPEKVETVEVTEAGAEAAAGEDRPAAEEGETEGAEAEAAGDADESEDDKA